MKVGIEELNGKDGRGFVEAVGWVFEHSPWVAERAWKAKPFASLDALYEAMVAVVASAAEDEQLALLRAHPDLGTAIDAMSHASRREQSGAGLDALSPDERQRLRALNAAYRDKFGFPFLFAVRGADTRDVLAALERRLTSARDIERQEALRHVYRIARFRLEEVVVAQ